MPLRFAGALVRRALMPQTAGALAMEVAPDLLGAGLTMMSAPDGTPLQERLLIGAEDLALGLGGSVAGRFGGGQIAAHLGDPRQGVRRQLAGIESGAGMGGMVGGMGMAMLGPRPAYDAMRRRMEEEARQQQDQQMQGVFEQGLMAGAERFADGPRVVGLDQMLYGLYS